MKKRILTGLTITMLAISTNLWAQAYIPECRNALQTLNYYGQRANLGTLVKQACPQIHNGNWLNGTGAVQKDGSYGVGCDAAWMSLSQSPALVAGKEFVTRNCPPMYEGLAWLPGPASISPIPACDLAVQTLAAAGEAVQAGNAVKNHCIQLYQNGWLVQTGGGTNTCPVIWNGLTNTGMLQAAHDVITHNCPWLYTNGYVAVNAPIVP